MRAIGERARLTEIGWDKDLVFEVVDEPVPDATGDKVLVEVEACGVCYRDLIDRSGRFPFLQTPITPGHEAAGRVVDVGPRVQRWQVGDRVATLHRDYCGNCSACARGDTCFCTRASWVLGLLADGGYARHLLVPENALYAVPAELSSAQAAVLHCTYGSAWRGLVVAGRLEKGERALITGANGGVGAAGVELAARLGASVTAVVRDEKHVARMHQLGAHDVIVDREGAFHKHPSLERADVVLECVGKATFNASLRSLAVGGRMGLVGNIDPEQASLNLGFVIVNGLRIEGPGGCTPKDIEGIVALHREAPLEFLIDRTLPLAQADAAQRLVRAGGLEGRIVLVPGA
ncbi:MAG: alcohol dehydrogenase catalytic domain-containing protein [bacterium]